MPFNIEGESTFSIVFLCRFDITIKVKFSTNFSEGQETLHDSIVTTDPVACRSTHPLPPERTLRNRRIQYSTKGQSHTSKQQRKSVLATWKRGLGDTQTDSGWCLLTRTKMLLLTSTLSKNADRRRRLRRDAVDCYATGGRGGRMIPVLVLTKLRRTKYKYKKIVSAGVFLGSTTKCP